MPKTATRFEFSNYRWDAKTRIFASTYITTLQDGSKETYTETLSFPQEIPFLPQSNKDKTEIVFQSLHLMLGISYWKLYCPRDIHLNGFTLTKHQADFWNTVYTKGLGEFFYKNHIDYHGLVQFPHKNIKASPAQSLELPTRALLPLGGGKDSLVSAEMLKARHIPFDVWVTNPHPLHTNLTQHIGAPFYEVHRTLDPKLFEVIKSGGAYDGHVPMTAIHSFIYLTCAMLFGYNVVVLSNEKSASYGNVEYLGETINHQWSKSEEFEHILQEYVTGHIAQNLKIFSLLRPYYEIEIARRFVETGRVYFPYFSSCNRNFSYRGSKNPEGKLWCGECPKCAFVFALFAAFLPKTEVVQIFGKDLYADAKLLPTYRELLSLINVKPFECVGTPEETAVAFSRARMRKEFAGEPAMVMFEREALPKFSNLAPLEKELFASHAAPNIPKEFV